MAADTIVGGAGIVMTGNDPVTGLNLGPKRGLLYPSEAAVTVPGGVDTLAWQPPIGADIFDTVNGGGQAVLDVSKSTASTPAYIAGLTTFYAQDTAHPNGMTNYDGCNPEIAIIPQLNAEKSKVGTPVYDAPGDWMASPMFTCPTNLGANLSSGALRYATLVYTTVALVPTDQVTIANGIATKDNATGTHDVNCTITAADLTAGGGKVYFWAVAKA
jgi:hypothetical protein